MKGISKRIISFMIIMVLIFSSMGSFAADDIGNASEVDVKYAGELMGKDNLLLVGDFVFDLNKTVGSTLNANNLALAMQTVYKESGDEGSLDSVYQYYHKLNGQWRDVISGNVVAEDNLNSDSKIKFYEMDQVTKELPLIMGDSSKAIEELTLAEAGISAINENQLGFLTPAAWSEEPDNFSGWLMMYSKSNIEDVWNHVSTLDNSEIDTYCNTDNVNKIYKVSNFSWADGVGNSFRANQKDVLSGEDFGAGVYNFYVGTHTEEGVVALVRLNQIIDILPVPQNVSWSGAGDIIDGYAVSFESENDERIKSNALLYSKSDLYTLMDENGFDLINKTVDEMTTLASDGKAKIVTDLSGTINFDADQKDVIDGASFDKDVYNIYAIALGESNVLGVNRVIKHIITADVPDAKVDLLNDGKGYIIPAGGHTSSTDPDAVEFYNFIKESAGGTPRIAIFSSSRDTSSVVENHYFYDHPDFGSLKGNFES